MDKLVIFLLIIFLVFWGAILFQTPEFLEIARASMPLALFIWIGGSAVNVAGIMFAAIVGLGLGREPVEDYTPGPTHGKYFQPGKDDWKCQSFKDWLRLHRESDDRDEWARREEERRNANETF
jgi:hypothetical protein